MKRILLFLAAFALSAAVNCHAQTSCLRKEAGTTKLIVDGKPFLILGGELGNSSAANTCDIERIFPKLQRMGLNTVLVPAYWDLLEPEEGNFDFTLTDKVLEQARVCGLKVVFLWFGAWKNSMSCYAPLWFKKDHEKYPRAHTQSGKPLEIASAFSDNVLEADCRAFTQWLRHIAEKDKNEGTVVMIQIENEIGMLEDARDYSPAADKAFHAPMPRELVSYLKKHEKDLHPWLKSKWETQGFRKEGSWREVFGTDTYTDEIFMAWHYAKYVETLAQSARTAYDVPLYVNAALNSRGRKPGEYPSAGPLAHLIDIWHCAAPNVDILAPDIYDEGFTDWVSQYHLHNNPLFIPEIRLSDNDGVRALYVFGEHEAIGFSPFSIEDYHEAEDAPLSQSYGMLKELMPLLSAYQGKGCMHGLLFDMKNKERIIMEGERIITCRHYFTLPWDARAIDGSVWQEGGGILLRMSENEYIIAGSGIVVEFAMNTEQSIADEGKILGEDGFVKEGNVAGTTGRDKASWQGRRCGIGHVDEVKVNADGSLGYVRRMNGDQTHQGRHVRIPVGQFSILHVVLYDYK